MATLPAATDFTGAAITEAQFKAAIADLRTFLADQLGTAGTVATALNTLGTLCNDYITKSAAYTVVAADRGRLFGCTGTFDLSLTAAATLGDGFSFAVRCVSGTLTLNPSGAELIDGEATLALAAGESCIVVCTGTAWNTIGRTVSNGQFQTMQVYTSSGTWTKPSGLKRIRVTVVGGGGGSGGSSGTYWATGGGGGGGCAIEVIEASSLLASESYVVGTGGTAGTTTTGGGTGVTSSFGTAPYLQATGGTGSAAVGNTYADGVAGGVGSNGSINIAGTAGGARTKYYDPNISDFAAQPGTGGSSHFGGGGATGAIGGAYGGGGGGVVGSAAVGKAGAAGVVIVEEFF